MTRIREEEEWQTNSKSYVVYRTVPLSTTLNNPYPGFKVTLLFDAEYLRNGTRYGHSFSAISNLNTPNSRVSFRMTLSVLAKYLITQSIMVCLWQLSFLFSFLSIERCTFYMIYCHSPGGDTASALGDRAFYTIYAHSPQCDTASSWQSLHSLSALVYNVRQANLKVILSTAWHRPSYDV